MAYCMYLRKSRSDAILEAKGEMETLARHEGILRDLAQSRGIEIAAIYKELVSGDSISARPQMQKLLQDVKNEKWEGVLVTEIERLARGDTIDQGIVARAFKLSRTKIVTPQKDYDPENEFDEEYFEFGLFMSRREYKTIRRRIQSGRDRASREGKWVSGTAPYGYSRVKIENDKGFTLKENAESDHVRLIYRLYLDGMGCGAIAHRLDELGIPTEYGGSWSPSTISDILKNPVYTGKIRYGYRVCKTVSEKTLRVTSENPISADGIHPAIIDPETFERAAEIRQTRHKPVKSDLSLKNPLSGLVFCADCGRAMTRLGSGARHPVPTLRCPNPHCKNVSSPLDSVEKCIVDTAKEIFSKYEIDIARQKREIIDETERIVQSIDCEIKKTELRISKTFEFLELGIYSVETFKERHSALSRQMIDYQTAKKEVLSASKGRGKDEKFPQIKHIFDGYDALCDARDRNAILSLAIRRVTYRKDAPSRRGHSDEPTFELTITPRFI